MSCRMPHSPAATRAVPAVGTTLTTNQLMVAAAQHVPASVTPQCLPCLPTLIIQSLAAAPHHLQASSWGPCPGPRRHWRPWRSCWVISSTKVCCRARLVADTLGGVSGVCADVRLSSRHAGCLGCLSGVLKRGSFEHAYGSCIWELHMHAQSCPSSVPSIWELHRCRCRSSFQCALHCSGESHLVTQGICIMPPDVPDLMHLGGDSTAGQGGALQWESQ
jgi:hypothetical protein